MPDITIRPAQGSDFHPMQAMSNGEGGGSCYPSFVAASHKFFVATQGFSIVGFVCAYPSQDKTTRFVQMMEPYIYTRLQDQGVEDKLRAAVLEWAEQRLDIHFFREDYFTLHPIKPHDYLQSLKYDPLAETAQEPNFSLETSASQDFSARQPEYALG